jgi:DNA-binding MarR family transcriptional regulator
MANTHDPSQTEQTEVQALAENLRDTIGKFVRAVRKQAGTPSTAQGETLAFLERDGPVSIATLAESRGVKHQSMRLVIAKLQESGLVMLLPDPNDGRSYLVTLTKAGMAENAAVRAARTRWLTGVLSTAMSAHERAILREALPLLQKITDLD